MPANQVNGWREVLARIFEGFPVELGLTPEWLVNPETNRRLKLDCFYPDIAVGVRFVGMEGAGRRHRKSDAELLAEESREQARAAVCREHGVILISIDPDGEPRIVLRSLEMGLARASAQLARADLPHARKQVLMPRLSGARQKVGEFTTKLAKPEKLNLYAEMWWDRQAAQVAQAPAEAKSSKRQAYKVGMAVVHDRFGPGQVTAVEPDDGDTKVTVEFITAGVRSFYAGLVGDKLLPE